MADSLPSLTPAELTRYSRHILLSEIGLVGQQKLAAARVLVVGAGGLGSPAALYLAAAGVGTLGLADFDTVEAHNLQRQILHTTASVGSSKLASAAQRIHEINPHVRFVPHPEGVQPSNAVALFAQYDVIVDGSDNFSTRFLNNDAAFFARKPLVYGSIFKFEGQVSVFHPAAGGPCYRCLFPEPPPPGSVPTCGEAGVIGALCGVIGSLQALEAIKLVVGFGEPLLGRLLTYNALQQRMHTLTLPADPDCPLCGTNRRIQAIDTTDYTFSCTPPPSSSMSDSCPLEVSVEEAQTLLSQPASPALLVDVREPYEREICSLPGALAIPLRQIPESLAMLPRDRRLLIHCHHGGRSLRVTEFLRAQGYTEVSNVAGGIEAWALRLDPKLRRY